VQRSTPSPHPGAESPALSENEVDDGHLQPGVRTPARGPGGTTPTLETVQEASPLGSPQVLKEALEKLDGGLSDVTPPTESTESTANKTLKPLINLAHNESGSENGSVKSSRRTAATSAPPPLASRQSSTSGKKMKGEGSLQNMTVETETVASIPQVAVAPATQVSNGTLRRNPSAETLRPKKDKKKSSRKQPAVAPGTGEHDYYYLAVRSEARHQPSPARPASTSEPYLSPTRPCGQGPQTGDDESLERCCVPSSSREQRFSLHNMNHLLTRTRTVSSKADIFEAKVASAVDEADTSDSEETFVYDSNPPDGRDRPHRFHSRTPSATSMASQVDRNGMRSIHSVLDGPGPAKKGMKFVNTFSSGNDSGLGDDEGTGRSNSGSGRGTARHHHHFSRWNRGLPNNGHPSLFDNDGLFPGSAKSKLGISTQSRQSSSGPPSPRLYSVRGTGNGKRGLGGPPGYDLDDTTGADDERTPLMSAAGGLRSARYSRRNRGHPSLRSLEDQSYDRRAGFLNRFATCLVIVIMLMLVVSGAIGLMFATSQPLEDIELVKTMNIIASEQELLFDLMVRARNPNIVVVTIDSATVEIFAKSPHAGTDSDYWRRPQQGGKLSTKGDFSTITPIDPPDADKPPNATTLFLGRVAQLDTPLSFEGAFFHGGLSASTAGVRLLRPANETDGGSERWEKILQDEFTLVTKITLNYYLPLSQRVRSAILNGKTKVLPNSPGEPGLQPNPPPPGNKTELTNS
jgi:hypothetical protein